MAINDYLLYHTPLHAPSRFIRLIFAEKGIDFNLRSEKFWDENSNFRELSHWRDIPVLQLDDTVVCGAIPIAEYMEEELQGRKIYGDSFSIKAENRRLVEYFIHRFEAEVNKYIVGEKVFKYMMGQPSDTALIQAGRNNKKQHLKYLDTMLQNHMDDGSSNFLHENREVVLNGSTLSAGDFVAGATISVLDYLGEINWLEYPNIADWYSRVKSRPTFQSILEDFIPFVEPSKHYKDLDFMNAIEKNK